VRASTLPRRRGDVTPGGSTPRNSPNRLSPRTSTPSVDSAVGSAEGLGVGQQGNLEEIRPRSDGSDSLATSSALTSPEPLVPEMNEPRVDLAQTDAPTVEMVSHETVVYPTAEGNMMEEGIQKGTSLSLSLSLSLSGAKETEIFTGVYQHGALYIFAKCLLLVRAKEREPSWRPASVPQLALVPLHCLPGSWTSSRVWFPRNREIASRDRRIDGACARARVSLARI